MIEKAFNASKTYNKRVTIKLSYSIESNPEKAKKLLKAHVSYVTRVTSGESKPFTTHGITMTKNNLKTFVESSPKENEKIFRFIISPENTNEFASEEDFKRFIDDCMKQLCADVHVPLEWKCEKHGPFWATPREVMSKRNGGTWCPTCGKEKSNRTKMDKTFARIKAYAIERGGVCISESYDTARQKLNFRCFCGNEWPAEPTSMLLQRSWCPTCGAKRGGFAAKKYIRKPAGMAREQLSLF